MGVDTGNFVRDVIAGSSGGAAQIVVGHPFDTVKVKLQNMPGSNIGALEVARGTLASEGLSGLFKGMGAPLATVSILNAVLFSANGALQSTARKVTHTPMDQALSLQAYAACGAGAGVFVALVACPTELVKCRLQSQASTGVRYAGPVDCVKQVVRSRGLAGLYKGFAPTLAREVPGGVVYFTTYESLKSTLTTKSNSPSKVSQLVAGGFAGVAFWSAVYPMDLIKTRIQTQAELKPKYRNMIDCGRHIYAEGGLRSLYRGAAPGIVRAFPANAVCFLLYEAVKEELSKSP